MVENKPVNLQYNIQVIDKCLELLEVIAQHPRGITLADLCRELNLHKSSIFRYLVTLESHGYLVRTDGDRFQLGLKLLELGEIVHQNLNFRELALPVMRELQTKYHETVNLAVLDGKEVVYIEILESSQALRMAARPGSRDLLHSTALGKAILAYWDKESLNHLLEGIELVKRTEKSIMSIDELLVELEQVHRQGYAFDMMENEDGVHCIGAPIFDLKGIPVAAISISGPSYRISANRMGDIGKDIAEQGYCVSRKLGFSGNIWKK